MDQERKRLSKLLTHHRKKATEFLRLAVELHEESKNLPIRERIVEMERIVALNRQAIAESELADEITKLLDEWKEVGEA